MAHKSLSVFPTASIRQIKSDANLDSRPLHHRSLIRLHRASHEQLMR